MDSRAPISEDYDSLVTSYQQRLYFFIRSMVYNKDDARDVLQDVNIVLIKKQSYFVAGTNFKAWAFKIARFECLNYLQRLKKFTPVTLDEQLLSDISNQAEEMSDNIDPAMVAMAHCLKSLPAKSKNILSARYSSKDSLEDTANELSTTVGALKQKLFRIRAKLKECIESKIYKIS